MWASVQIWHFEAYVEDFLVDYGHERNIKDRILSHDWYDSHVNRAVLIKLFAAGVFAVFTENDCTDILAMPDGGGIKALKSKINLLVEKTVDNNIETWYGTTPASKGLRRE